MNEEINKQALKLRVLRIQLLSHRSEHSGRSSGRGPSYEAWPGRVGQFSSFLPFLRLCGFFFEYAL